MSKRLSAEEELALAVRARAGDREAEARLIIEHLIPAYSLVNRYVHRWGVPKEDLEQEAALGLLTAVRRFEPDRGVRFLTYAMWWVRVGIQRTCRGWRYLSQEPPADNIRWIENMAKPEKPPPADGIDLRVLLRVAAPAANRGRTRARSQWSRASHAASTGCSPWPARGSGEQALRSSIGRAAQESTSSRGDSSARGLRKTKRRTKEINTVAGCPMCG